MRISFVADYRSPIARQWIDQTAQAGFEVHVVSSMPLSASLAAPYEVEVEPLGPLALLQQTLQRQPPHTAFGSAHPVARRRPTDFGAIDTLSQPLRRAAFRHLVAPAMRASTARLGLRINNAKPQVVHAMRLPFEAMAVSRLDLLGAASFMASVWGNDLTLHGGASASLRRATSQALARIDGLHTDCQRDRQLALSWGFDPSKPTLLAPGSGGVQLSRFRPDGDSLRQRLKIPADAPVVLNARGVREYVNLPAFFGAISLLLARRPDVHVICAAMAGNQSVRRLLENEPNRRRIHLLAPLRHDEMPALYRSAQVVASLTRHDGTPNSLLEAMACGCFPVVAPVASVLEWVDHGKNGLVVPEDEPATIADACGQALDQQELRTAGALVNRQQIEERAELYSSMQRAFEFYERMARGRGKGR